VAPGWTPLQKSEALASLNEWFWSVKRQPTLTARYVLQTLGTEWGRSLDTDIWVKALIHKITEDGGVGVITDVRFLNEASALQGANRLLIKIERPGSTGLLGSFGAHYSESELESEDMKSLIHGTMINDRDIENLGFKAMEILHQRRFL
jgi:hypothetical protein